MVEELTPEQKEIADVALYKLAEMGPITVLKIMWHLARKQRLAKQARAFTVAIRELEGEVAEHGINN